MNDDFDDLDRALFALPLEQPPPELRAAILRATVGAALTAKPAFRPWEVVLVGLGLAVMVWLASAFMTDHAFATAVRGQIVSGLVMLAEPATAAWLVAGGAIALFLSPGTLGTLRVPDSDRA